jgi:hypothetical protein
MIDMSEQFVLFLTYLFCILKMDNRKKNKDIYVRCTEINVRLHICLLHRISSHELQKIIDRWLCPVMLAFGYVKLKWEYSVLYCICRDVPKLYSVLGIYWEKKVSRCGKIGYMRIDFTIETVFLNV